MQKSVINTFPCIKKNMDVEDNLSGFDEIHPFNPSGETIGFYNPSYPPEHPDEIDLFKETGLVQPLSPGPRTWGAEFEIHTTNTDEIIESMRVKGFTKKEIEVEKNGLEREGISEIKSHPFGFGPDSDLDALKKLYSTTNEFFRSALETGANVKLGPYDPETGHTAGIHVHISGNKDDNGDKDLMKIVKIMKAYKPIIMVLANPNNRERVEAFGYTDDVGIASSYEEKKRYKKCDILINRGDGLVELRVIPMSEGLGTAFMIPKIVHTLITNAEYDPGEMRRIEYLVNNSPSDSDLTYAGINRNRAIMDGLDAYLWDVKFVIEDDLLMAISYEKTITEAIDECLTRVGFPRLNYLRLSS